MRRHATIPPVDAGDILLRAILEGNSAPPFTARKARILHDENPSESHLFLQNFFYGPAECPWCNDGLCSTAV